MSCPPITYRSPLRLWVQRRAFWFWAEPCLLPTASDPLRARRSSGLCKGARHGAESLPTTCQKACRAGKRTVLGGIQRVLAFWPPCLSCSDWSQLQIKRLIPALVFLRSVFKTSHPFISRTVA